MTTTQGRMARWAARAGLVWMCAGLLVGCGASRESALDKDNLAKIGQATQKGDFEAAWAAADAAWEGRVEEAKLREAIALYEKVAAIESPNLSPEERRQKLTELYVRVARGYYFLADSHIRIKAKDDELNDEMMKVFDQGIKASEKAIALADPDFAKKVAADPGSWQQSVTSVKDAALPALYWYATNMGKWALLEGLTTILARKDDIKATMDHMIKKDPGYFYGAPHRYFAVYHTKVPIGGGDPAKSKASFEKSLEIAPNYLATRVLMAESLAQLTQDVKMFEEQLNLVLAAADDVAPEISPENTLEKKKAAAMLKKKDDLFY